MHASDVLHSNLGSFKRTNFARGGDGLNTKYYLSSQCRTLEKENRVILYNSKTGESIKISSECWKIINYLNEGFTIQEICAAAENEEDRGYLEKLFNKLLERELVISGSGDKEENQLESIDLVLTHKCNLKCIHCCVDASGLSESDLLSKEQMFSIIDKITQINLRIIVITGGEPMVREDFMDIMSHLRNNFEGKISLMTNGTLINRENVIKLSEYFDNFNISIDGYDEESCSLVRGKGVYDKVINSINLLKKAGISGENISLSMVKMATNLNGINKFHELNKELETQEVIREFDPIGRGRSNVKKLLYESSESYDVPICLPRAQTCAAGEKKLTINYDGSIYPCLLLDKEEYNMGNILEIENIQAFILEEQYKKSIGYCNLKKIMPQFHEKCSKCSVNAFCWYCLEDFYKCMKSGKFSEWCSM